MIYEKGRKYYADDYLVDYCRHFHTVEVDQWFWSLFPSEVKMPEARHVDSYAVSVPSDFVFTVKAPNSITLTHSYTKQPPQHRAFAGRPNEHFLSIELVEQFLDALSPLHSRLGPVMFQFEYLNTRKMPSREAFFEALDWFLGRLPAGFQYGVESRNPDYYCSSYFDLLRRHGVAVVLLDGYHMPSLDKVVRDHDTRCADFSIVRLHGPDRAGIEARTNKKWNAIVAPQPEGLRAAVDIVRGNSTNFIKTFVNVNNHYEGSAPLTIERFLNMLREDEQNAAR